MRVEASLPEKPRSLNCPRCRGRQLVPFSYDSDILDLCTRCRGLWCEPHDWNPERLGSAPEDDPQGERAPDIVLTGHGDLKCPDCSEVMTTLGVEAVKNLEIDQCDRCGGVWFDHREWEYLEAIRAWQRHAVDSHRSTSVGEWFFQFLLRLPIEFNVPAHRFPAVTVGIIASCFLLQILGGANVFGALAFRAETLPTWTGVATIFTHGFVHGDWFHLLTNMYFLYILGDNVEDVLGPFRFLILYALSGLAATLTFLVFHLDNTLPLVGASGAIAGIMAAYLLLFSHARLTFMLIVFQFKVPATAWLAIWFLLQIIQAFLDVREGGSNIAWWAHIGGFALGFVLIGLFKKRLIERHTLLYLLHHRGLDRTAKATNKSVYDARVPRA